MYAFFVFNSRLRATYIMGKFKLELEGLQRLANRRWEREQGRKDVTEDMSEDLSEGEKGDVLGETITLDSPRKKFQQNSSNSSNLEVWSESIKERKLYIVLIRTYLLD
nr:probable sucrose-phosphate synthase 2 [Ipomoea batatas]